MGDPTLDRHSQQVSELIMKMEVEMKIRLVMMILMKIMMVIKNTDGYDQCNDNNHGNDDDDFNQRFSGN